MLTRSEVAALVDHTLLKPEATEAAAAAAYAEGLDLGVYAVCLSPSMLPIATGAQKSCVVAGFPSGKHHSLVKAAEARLAVDSGADEVEHERGHHVLGVGGDFRFAIGDEPGHFVRNLTDEQPPLSAAGYVGTVYQPYGRYWYVSLRKTF